MANLDLLSLELDDCSFTEVAKVANDEFSCDTDYNCVFFFGTLVDDCDWIMDRKIDEDKYYTQCPNCNTLIELDEDFIDGEEYTCPHCGATGALFDYHDPDSAVNDYYKLYYGCLEKLDKGYVLRLFEVGLDFSDRDYSDYTRFDFDPMLTITEVGREYWYEGEVKYYENSEDAFSDPKFKPVSVIDDSAYIIVNYFNDFVDYGSERIDDILYENPFAKTFIETISKRGTYRIFNTLSKYGFNQLLYDFVYVSHVFGDSNKISEVLQLDYNQVIADMKAGEIDAYDILAMRELSNYGLTFSQKNVRIMRVLSNAYPIVFSGDNVGKTFKYLRNQMSKAKNVDYIVRDYVDYLSDCRKLGLDTESGEIRYPTDLLKAHERTTELVRIEANRDTDERIREVYDRLHEFCEYSDRVYRIIMPTCCDDIIREGKEQSHCVGGYCERMAKGEDIILFLRKAVEPDKSFYTLEIRPSMKKLELVQCRGYKNEDENEQIRASVDEFLSRYEAWFNSRKCDVDTVMRRKYYKAVCKDSDGRYISHWDNKTEYRIGEVIEACMDNNPDLTAVQGIHIASLDFAKNYGDAWPNAAIIEIEVDMRDVVIPNAKDQLRTRRGKVLREVPLSELGDWGVRHAKAVTA